jgi:hypothetical protein
MNQTDHVRFVEFFEREIKRAAGALYRESLTPGFSCERPPNLECRPASRIEEPYPTDETSGSFFFDGEVSITQQLPMTN